MSPDQSCLHAGGKNKRYTCGQTHLFYCIQVLWEPGVAAAELPEAAWAQLARTELGGEDGQEETVTTDTPLLVNIKGCGYPPDTVCDTYYETHKVGMVYIVRDGFDQHQATISVSEQ